VKSIRPINYVLEFNPNFKNFTFQGKEILEVKISKPTNLIILNSAELKITKCHIEYNGEKISAKPKLDKKKEELRITLSKKIINTCKLYMEFTGILNDRLLGFYRSQYKQKGKTKFLATTQFEAADARRVFPCWDEPEAKATFEISIITDNNLSAISNMPEISKKKLGKKTLHKFAKTPTMSTYLIYLGVGDFEFLKSKQGKIDVRVVTTKGNKSKGKFALELGEKLLNSYEQYFGIKYPLPKLDLIAVPDFAAGAMENWGAITFRETILLYDPKTSTTKTKQYIAEVISHEIAHQWFGNLVTMKWWNDLWLNESFATFMATKFVDKFYPEWDLWDQFVEDAMNQAMGIDSLKSSHPIDVKVNSPAEVREIFDAISYDKGGCILRMLENYVGESNFQKGLKYYLKKYQYKNAEGKNLWAAIGKISKLPVTSMVNSWIKQVGFPLIEVSTSNSTLKLRQKRFLLESHKPQKNQWIIPLSIGLSQEFTKKLFSKKTDSLKLPQRNRNFIVNFGRNGFYRVKYDEGILLDLKYLVSQKEIPHIDRWAIQNDLFALCAGEESVQNYLDFSDAYNDEDNYLVTVNVAKNLNSLYNRTFNEDFAYQIKDYTINYFVQIFTRLGWDAQKNEKHTDALLRSLVIGVLGRLGDSQITEEAHKRFKKFLENPDFLSADLREPVFSIIAWNGNAKTHKTLIRLFTKAKTQEEKLRFLGALCSFKDEKLLKKSLDFSQTSAVRSQNMQLPIMRVSTNPYGKNILWPWLKKNWKKLNKKVGHGNPLFNRIVASISLVVDDSMEKEIRQFFKKNPTPGTERTLEQTLERVRINTRFLKRMRQEFNY